MPKPEEMKGAGWPAPSMKASAPGWLACPERGAQFVECGGVAVVEVVEEPLRPGAELQGAVGAEHDPARVQQHGSLVRDGEVGLPGDFTSATETFTGQNNFTVPHMGAVFLNAGRVVFGADGTLEFSAGPQEGLDYSNGNTAAVDELCTALGAS